MLHTTTNVLSVFCFYFHKGLFEPKLMTYAEEQDLKCFMLSALSPDLTSQEELLKAVKGNQFIIPLCKPSNTVKIK